MSNPNQSRKGGNYRQNQGMNTQGFTGMGNQGFTGMGNQGMAGQFQMPQPGFTPAPGQGMGMDPGVPPGAGGMLPQEQSYIENILRLNKGKLATFYFTFEEGSKWQSKIFRGIIEAAGRDHIIISDPETGKRYLLLMIYLDYVTFDEPIEYSYPYGLAQYSPR